MKTRLCHEILHLYYSKQGQKFATHLSQLEQTQRERLKALLANVQGTEAWKNLENSSYEEIIQKIPVRSYADFQDLIEKQRQTGKSIVSRNLVRYEPTSGSTEKRKWIPYTKEFLGEINQAAAAWLSDIYQRYPKVKEGRHYWSLSWLPKELRALMSSDDADLFPFFQRWILKNTMAMPSSLSLVSNPQAAWWGTLVQLASLQDLTLVSVWSPTFWLKVLKDIQSQWPLIAQALQAGKWLQFEEELNENLGALQKREIANLNPQNPDFFRKLWPQLQLISAWDSSSSQAWFQELQIQMPHVAFQGKGLWATEGVVTFPFQNQKVLAIDSHFYEFRNLRTQEIFPSWKLKEGEMYQPILWTSSGLLRYAMPDQVQVAGFLGEAPCLDFKGRIQGVDLVGEKISSDWVQQLFDQHPEWKAICLVACRNPQPHYVLFHQHKEAVEIEVCLLEAHHYKVARELGQLQPARSESVEDLFELLPKISRSPIVGQNKIEILLQVDDLRSASSDAPAKRIK